MKLGSKRTPHRRIYRAGDPPGSAFLAGVAETIRRGSMVAAGDRVLVAVSGGPDSVALWRALESLAKGLQVILAMVHINYHLRGEESDADESFCRELARAAKARVFVRSRRLPARSGKSVNLQDWARRARYEAFESIAQKHDFNRIAVGHHYDDQVETVAAGLLGGRGSFALTGIPRVRGCIFRPLFDCRRAEIVDFLRQIGQPYREDKSNLDRRYLRNRIRHDVLPEWRERYNPQIDRVLFDWAGFSSTQTKYMEDAVIRFLARAAMGWGKGWLSIDLKKLRHCDRRLDYYILNRVAQRLGVSDPAPGEQTVRRFGKMAEAGRSGQKLVWGRAIIEVSRGAITFYLGRPSSPQPVKIEMEGATEADNWELRITCRSMPGQQKADVRIPRKAWRLCSDAAAITPPVVLRGPRPGERIRPLGMTGRKKIFDVLAEAGVPGLLRPRAPVLEDRRGIFWVVGHHQDERVKVTRNTRKLLLIDIERLTHES